MPALLTTTSVALGYTSCDCNAGLASSASALLVVPPVADSTVCCHGPSIGFCTCTCTGPARLAVPEALTRSEVAPAMLLSAHSRPGAGCVRLPASAVVWLVPAPPGGRVPALGGAPLLLARIPSALLPVAVMLPVEVTVTAAALSARIPDAPPPAVVMLPVEVTVTAPLAVLPA